MTRSLLFCCIFCALLGSAAAQEKSNLILDENFTSYKEGADGSPTWHPVKGSWQILKGAYIQKAPDYDCASLLDTFLTGSFRMEIHFQHMDGDLGAGFVFSSSDLDETDYAQMARFDGSGVFIMGYYQNGEFTATASARADPVEPMSVHVLTLSVDRDKNEYGVELDGRTIRDRVPLVFPGGYCGLECSGGGVKFLQARLSAIPMATTPLDLPWVKRFAVTKSAHLVIPSEHEGVLQIVDERGARLRTLGSAASRKGLFQRPSAVALMDDSTLAVTDRGNNRLHLITLEGIWKGSAGWKGSAQGQLDDPVGLAVNSARQVFVVERTNARVQVFDDQLRPIAQFGHDKLKDPGDIAISDSTLYVLNTGLSQVECYRWNGRRAVWKKSLSYGGGEGRGIAATATAIYVSVVNEVRMYDTSGVLLRTLRARALDFILPWGIQTSPEGGLLIADYFLGRIVATTTGLLDPQPSVSWTAGGEAAVSWKGTVRETGRILLARGDDTVTVLEGKTSATDHTISIGGLRPGATYRIRFTPTLRTIPPARQLSRPYPLAVPPGKALTSYARLPVAALIFTNVRETGTDGRELPAAEIERIKNQLADGVRFYWIHSGMRLFLDLDTFVIHDPLLRSQVYGNEWWYPPRESVLVKYLSINGKRISDYSGYLFLTCPQVFDTTHQKWVLAGKGGGFTNGVGTGKGYGISWWDVTRRNHNAGNNWLMVHEFNHQLDDVFLMSGYPEYWFNHISPTIGTAADFGEHFDANAYILRIVPDDEWLDLRYTSIMSARDSDNDGIPDSDSRLPLDEERLGSDPRKVDTDGDGISDFAELRFSDWIKEGWGESYGGKAIFPNLHEKDTDQDGLPDNIDPYPCYPVRPEIHRRTTSEMETGLSPFAILTDEKIIASISSAWNDSVLRFGFQTDRPVPIKIMVDANADGWFMGRDNILVTLTPSGDSSLTTRVQIQNASDPRQWPFMDDGLASRVRINARMHPVKPHGALVELSLGSNEDLGLSFREGKRSGILVGFLCPFDGEGVKRYVDVFEPNRLFTVEFKR